MTPEDKAKEARAYLWMMAGVPEQEAEDYAVRLGRLPDQAVMALADYARSTGDVRPVRSLQLPQATMSAVTPGPVLPSQGGQALFNESRRPPIPLPTPIPTIPGSYADSSHPGIDRPIPTIRRDDLLPTLPEVPEKLPPLPDKNAQMQEYLTSRVAMLAGPGGGIQAARERVALAEWAAKNYDPANYPGGDYDQVGIRTITSELDHATDNLRQQELADRSRGSGPVGPSAQALRLMELEAQQIEANLTGQYQGQPTYAAQQAEQARADAQQGHALTAATGMQSREDQLQQIAAAAMERSKARVIAGAGSYGGYVPTASDLLAFNPEPARLLPEYQQATSSVLSGLAGLARGG